VAEKQEGRKGGRERKRTRERKREKAKRNAPDVFLQPGSDRFLIYFP